MLICMCLMRDIDGITMQSSLYKASKQINERRQYHLLYPVSRQSSPLTLVVCCFRMETSHWCRRTYTRPEHRLE
ncbi:CLUMA_CG008946, isoform A [Clunio marinus]|uniref:CLUMA_CG008946, isoform A n=1 Tax=Clunio marinus TaxID=568069 RepID=A0A1J1I5B2_9DIPT|nr:CLUMA_CG008946, isoform A [Clunio marinus]